MSKSNLTELNRQRVRSAWLFLAPMLVVLTLVAVWPLTRTIWLSFTDAKIDMMSGPDVNFVGLSNYIGQYGLFFTGSEMINAEWWQAVKNTFFFAFVSVTLETILGLAVALVLNAEFKGRALVRTAVLVPWAIPTIVSAKMWDWMLQQQFGIINLFLATIGFERIAFTTDYPMLSVLIADVWKTTPFMALLILAALQMLPKYCYEAAKVDGISPVKFFFKVTSASSRIESRYLP